MFERDTLLILYQRLYDAYGPQHWWPGDTPFEVMVGAVLTQNTAWTNVEKGINNLKQAARLEPAELAGMPEPQLAMLIRPTGYFNVKARRLQALCNWIIKSGGIRRLNKLPTGKLRPELLSVHGIGPETADAILLYAFNRPVFVIDAYTRRLLQSLRWINGNEDYETLRAAFESALSGEYRKFNEYHALIVRHAKEKCQDRVECRHCTVERPFAGKV